MATHSSVLAWRIPGSGDPGGLLSVGSHGVRHDWSDLAVAPEHPLKQTENSRSSHCQQASHKEDAAVSSNFWCFDCYSDQFFKLKMSQEREFRARSEGPWGAVRVLCVLAVVTSELSCKRRQPSLVQSALQGRMKAWLCRGKSFRATPGDALLSGLHSQRKIDGLTTDCLVKVILSWGAQKKWALVEAGRSGERWSYQLSWLRRPGGEEIFINLVILQDRKRQAWSKFDLEKPVHQVEKRAFFGPEKQELSLLSTIWSHQIT